MIDWLDPEVPAEWLARFLALIHDTPRLDWLLLTKRPHLWRDRIESAYDAATRETQTEAAGDALLAWLDCVDSPERGNILSNVWIGVSAEDQKRWDERVPALLRIPAAVRFVSVEPMLELIDMKGYWGMKPDWLIFGGESGPGARPCHIEWIRDGLRQCRRAGVSAFVKQLGSNARHCSGMSYCTVDTKGGAPAEWPEDLRVREWPNGKEVGR